MQAVLPTMGLFCTFSQDIKLGFRENNCKREPHMRGRINLPNEVPDFMDHMKKIHFLGKICPNINYNRLIKSM